MRKSSKDFCARKNSVNRRLRAEADAAIKAPPVETFSARMPAYTYTGLCPDPKLRRPPGPRPEHPKGAQPIKAEKICLICRKHWPIDCGRESCDCEQQGHLFSVTVYYQRKIGGGADER